MRREEMWKLINATIEPIDTETSSSHILSEQDVNESTSGVIFVHTIGVMPETVNDLIEEGRCARTDLSYADVILASRPVEEERIPVVYLNPDMNDASFYLLENAREIVPADLAKDVLLDRIVRYKRVQRVVDAVIVTDDPHLRRLLERELTKSFETLSLYERAEVFLEQHVATRPYLLVFSSALPRADGLELLLRAKQETIVPFHAIMISMYNRERDHVLAIERGVDGIMTLPLKVEEFRAWVSRLEGVRG
ncbi:MULTISPECIES: response regulator [Exiguobacterium]|uniref:response regulator n=1 Tax=Exiguobacterium TaxID=33986 RepID=UPI001BEC687C|nr:MULTISPECIES: response regulator [Exiguobacterium]MCT4792325.1 response regulator [Exiguobacterium artemiae]MDX1258326.1 response regulator [Exiguobacterium sp. K1]